MRVFNEFCGRFVWNCLVGGIENILWRLENDQDDPGPELIADLLLAAGWWLC